MSRRKRLTASEFSEKFLDWPERTNFAAAFGTEAWIRARPASSAKIFGAELYNIGTDKTATQPDGLYLAFGTDNTFCDAICFEYCNSKQNLNDKRSRYLMQHQTVQFEVKEAWLKSQSQTSRTKKMAEVLKMESTSRVPVRFLRVCYFVPSSIFGSIVSSNIGLSYEYFTSWEPNFTAPKMQEFLAGMSPAKNYLGKFKC